MDSNLIDQITGILRQQGVILADGLSDAEIASVEGRFGFHFPPDLRALLQTALPTASPSFPDWRNDSEERLRGALEWPRDGILFDIEHNVFWLKEWGPKPEDLAEAFSVAKQEIAKAPILIPIYSHRYISEEPHLPGNPIFSVYQTDIIYYGANLMEYFTNEFQRTYTITETSIREIRVWSKLVDINNGVEVDY